MKIQRSYSSKPESEVVHKKLVRCLSERSGKDMIPSYETSYHMDETDGPVENLHGALFCIKDAASQLDQVNHYFKQQWEKQMPDVLLEISDALQLQPSMAHLTSVTDAQKLKHLLLVLHILVELKKQCNSTDSQHLSRAIKAAENAAILLRLGGVRLDDTDNVNVSSSLGTTRQCLAAVMIVHHFFSDLMLQWTNLC